MDSRVNKLRLFRFVKPVLWAYILIGVANVVFVGLDMLSPQITRHLVDDVIVGRDNRRLNLLLFALLGVGVFRCFLGYFRNFLCDWAGSKVSCEVRKEFFRKIQSLSANFFDKNNPGELMARVKDDVDSIWGLFTYIGMLLCEVIVHVTFITFCMFRMNWRLALIPTVAMVICAVVAYRMEDKLGAMYEQSGEANQLLNNAAQENLNGVRTVKAFARQAYEIRKFRIYNDKFCNLNYEISRIFVCLYPVLQLFHYLIPLVVLAYGGYMTIGGKMSTGELTAFVQYSFNFVWPMEMLGWLTSGYSQATAGMKRINKIYTEEPQITSGISDAATDVGPVKGAIEFKDVSFTAESGTKILNGISFSIGAGQTLGIMGATGSGKTTIVNLLGRMYDVTSGSISIDGIDIRQMDLRQLRKSIAVVAQDVFLFSESISENIRLGEKDNMTAQQVNSALSAAEAVSFVSKMDDKENTIIGERGVGLSGGQKQRLTIARALARSAPILVLDDATSALDTETEHRIQKTLGGLYGMTKIIVAHRISAVRSADLIIVLDKGSIAEIGTHEELLKMGGLYAETYRTQYGEG